MVFLFSVETLAEAGKHAHEQQISQASVAAQVIYPHIDKAQAGLVQLPHLQFWNDNCTDKNHISELLSFQNCTVNSMLKITVIQTKYLYHAIWIAILA